MTGQRTYWHLESNKRKPLEYEIVSSKLHYYIGRGFEVRTPIAEWYERYQGASPLKAPDFDQFVDPQQLTYSKYVELAQAREIFVDGLFEAIEATHHDASLSAQWRAVLERVLAPLRYPLHALQMAAAYIGSMAPSGRITIACAFQAADEMRFIQHVAYRMRQLELSAGDFGKGSKQLWQADPAWQPLRKVVEHLLVTFDWAEALFALNLVIKPVIAELFMLQLGAAAAANGDGVLQKILRSTHETYDWHLSWSMALLLMTLRDVPNNRRCVDDWRVKYSGSVPALVRSIVPLLACPGATRPLPDVSSVETTIQIAASERWRMLGLDD